MVLSLRDFGRICVADRFFDISEQSHLSGERILPIEAGLDVEAIRLLGALGSTASEARSHAGDHEVVTATS